LLPGIDRGLLDSVTPYAVCKDEDGNDEVPTCGDPDNEDTHKKLERNPITAEWKSCLDDD